MLYFNTHIMQSAVPEVVWKWIPQMRSSRVKGSVSHELSSGKLKMGWVVGKDRKDFDVWGEHLLKVEWGIVMYTYVGVSKYKSFIGFWKKQEASDWCDVLRFCSFCQESSNALLDEIELLKVFIWDAKKSWIAIVQSWRQKGMDKSFSIRTRWR